MFAHAPESAAAVWVVAVALVDEQGRVLVQQRLSGGQHADLWEFPGGKLEVGESPQAAAIRELHEELAIVVDGDDLQAVTFASGSTGSPPKPLTILLFACERWEGIPKPLAAAALAWCEPEDLATWPMPPLDYPLAEALAAMRRSDRVHLATIPAR